MSNDFDIEMGLDDTLELDAIVQEWNPDTNLVSITPDDINNNYTHTGIQTKTSIFDPDDPGVYTVSINGQTLKINVTDPNEISGSIIDSFEDNNLSEYTVTTDNASVSTVSSPVYDGSYALNISVNTSSGGSGTVSSSSGLDIYPERGFPFRFYLNTDSSSTGSSYIMFGGQDVNNTYVARIAHDGGNLIVRSKQNGGVVDEKSVSLSLNSNTWYSGVIDWTQSSISFKMENLSGNKLASATINQTVDYNSQFIGFKRNQYSGNTNTTFDLIKHL